MAIVHHMDVSPKFCYNLPHVQQQISPLLVYTDFLTLQFNDLSLAVKALLAPVFVLSFNVST